MLRIRFAGCAALLLFSAAAFADITATKTFDVGPGSFSNSLLDSQSHVYRIMLKKGEAVVASLYYRNTSGEPSGGDVFLNLLDSKSVMQDGVEQWGIPGGSAQRSASVVFETEEAGVQTVLIEMERAGDVRLSYTLTLKVFPGHASPARQVNAVSGVYHDGLAFADVHEYVLALPKRKSFQALLNINSGTADRCYVYVGCYLFDARGSEVMEHETFGVPPAGQSESNALEYTPSRPGSYTLRVERRASNGGLPCNEAIFPYDLYLTIPNACTAKALKKKCSQSCSVKCKSSKNASCKPNCVKKCVAKGRC